MRISLLLILLLAGSNLVTAIGAYLVIDRIGERFVQEINATVPGMHEVMLLAQKATNVHRAAAALLVARNPAEEVRMFARLEEEREIEFALRNQILNTPESDLMEKSSRAALGQAATDYEAALRTYLELFKASDFPAAQNFRLGDLRDAFERYQQRQRDESVRLNLKAMQGGAEISAYANMRKSWLLSIGVWPLVLIGLILITVTVLGGILWRQLRRMEIDGKKSEKTHRLGF